MAYILTSRILARRTKSPRAPFAPAKDHWAGQMSLAYPVIAPYATPNFIADLSGRKRHLDTYAGGSVDPVTGTMSKTDLQGVPHTIQGLKFGPVTTGKALSTVASADDLRYPERHTEICWWDCENPGYNKYSTPFSMVKDTVTSQYYNFRISIRGGNGVSYDRFVNAGYGSYGVNLADLSAVDHYGLPRMMAAVYDESGVHGSGTDEFAGSINNDQDYNTANQGLGPTASFVGPSKIRLGGALDVATNFYSLNSFAWNCRMYDGIALERDQISELYYQPWLGYEEYGRVFYSLPSAAGGTTYDRTVSESLSFADTDNRTATFARDVAEALSFSDTVSRDPTFNRLVSETLSYTDDVTGIAGISRTASEALDFADTVNAQVTYARLVSETLSFTDTATRTAVYARAISESLEFLDTVSSSGGAEIETATKSGRSMSLAQMRRMERQQLLASIREDDEVIVTLISDLLKRNKRLQ